MEFYSILNPTIFIGDFEWQEPVTTLTDFLVAIVCWVAFFLFSKNDKSSITYKWFRAYFLIFAIGMTSAAWLGHGLQAYVVPEMKLIGWLCGATGILFLQTGSFRLIRNKLPKILQRFLPIWFVLQWLVAVVLMLTRISEGIALAFQVTQVNSAIGFMVFLLPMHVFSWKKLGVKQSRIIVIATFYSAIPGFVYSNQISIHRWFNYHDISHVLMAIFMTIMFLGLNRIENRGTAE